MLRFLFLFLSLSIFLFADSYGGFGERLPIYTIGDASPVADALNFVGMLAGSTAMKVLLTFGVVIALIRIAMKSASQDGKGAALEFVYILVVLFLFVLPSAEVQVMDGRIAKGGAAPPDAVVADEIGYVSAKSVDNIPIGLAAIASASTVFSWDLASLVDTVIAPISGADKATYLGVTQAGLNQPAKDISWIAKNIAKFLGGKNVDNYEYRLHEYVRVCALPTISLDITNAAKILKPADGDYETSLSPTVLPVAGTMIADPIDKGIQMDCSDFWDTYLSGTNAAAFEDNIYQQFRNYKKFDANGGDPNTEAGLHYLINGNTTSAIASLKDTTSSLRRGAVVASAVAAASTGIDGIDMSNRMAMTSAKQNIMVQGAANFAWLGEMLPMVISLGIAFLIVAGYLMSIFLLFQGWVKGIKVIANYAAGFFALGFSYVSLAVTQGIVNRRAYADAAEHYFSQGSNLQVSNYDLLLEQAATMDGLTGLLGAVFVMAGSAIVFYGESKYLIGGMLGKALGAYGGNNLDHTLEDNAKDSALTDSIQEAQRKDKMARKLAEAGIPVDGGNIEYEYARFQKELAELGSARGVHSAITGGTGATSADAMSAREGTIAGAAVQSMEKAVSLQGFGEQALSMNEGNLTKALDRAHGGALTKGKAAAAASMRESDILSQEDNQNAFIEGTARGAEVKAKQTIGAGKAKPEGGMEKYLDNMEKEATVGFLAKGVKAAAAAEHGLSKSDDGKLDKDYAEGLYRGEASGIEATKMKSRVNDDRNDYIANSAAVAFKNEAEGQAAGMNIRERFGDSLGGLAASVPYAGEKVPPSVKVPAIADIAEDVLSGKSLKVAIEAAKADLPKLPSDKALEDSIRQVSPKKSVSGPVRTPEDEKDEGVQVPSFGEKNIPENPLGLPFSETATEEEKRLMAKTGLSLSDVRKAKTSTIGHEAEQGDLPTMLKSENQYGYVGMAQFGAAALVDTGYVDKEKYFAATHKTKHGRAWNRGMSQKKFLADDTNWTIPGGKRAFMRSFEMQDDALTKLMSHNADTFKRLGVDLGDASHTKGLLMAAHLGGVGNAAKYAKYGKGFRDANGTSIGSYYYAGSRDIVHGYGGTVNTSGGGVRNSNTGSMTLKEIARAHARKNMDEWIASGQSIANTYQQDPSAYATAAAFREAGALMTSQSIEARGGIKSAINQGVMGAASEGSAEKAAFIGRTTQQLVSQGVNPQDAKKMAEEIANGSEKGAEKFKQAIMSAAGEASRVNASEQEGMSQAHAKNLRQEFGETLVEKRSSASGRTFSQEQDIKNEDAKEVKTEAWKKRKAALEKRRDAMAVYAGGNDGIAAAHVGEVLEYAIDSDPSLSTQSKKIMKFKSASIVADLKDGKEVGEDRIREVFGEHTGERVLSSLKANGVVFKDAKGIGTGDAIDTDATAVPIRQAVAGTVLAGALDRQEKINASLWNNGYGSISVEAFEERQNSIAKIRNAVASGDTDSLSKSDFLAAGFGEDTAVAFGFNDRGGHVSSSAVVASSVRMMDEAIRQTVPASEQKAVTEPLPSSDMAKKKTLEAFSQSRESAAAERVDAVLQDEIAMSDMDDSQKQSYSMKASVISAKIKGGEEVTDKEILSTFGEDLGTKAIASLKDNGVVFKDADGWFTGDAIDTEATGAQVRTKAARAYVAEAIAEQRSTNEKLKESGAISEEEYASRTKALDYLSMGLEGKNGGSMPFEYFQDGGFTQERLNRYGIKEAPTEYADGEGRMFQVQHIDNGAVLAKAAERIQTSDSPTQEKQNAAETEDTQSAPQEAAKPESQARSWNELADAQENKRVQEFIGSGTGILENIDNNPKTYAENAMYGEMSKASTTQAKIEAQEGIHKAVSIDTAESAIKASMQAGAIPEQAKQLAGDDEAAKKLAEGIKNGSVSAAEILAAGVKKAASDLGAAQAGARVASDMSQIKETGGKEAFIEASSVEGAKRGVTSRVQNIDVGDPEVANKQVQGILSTTKTEDRQKVLESLKNFGMVTEDSTLDNVQATSGARFIKGKAAAAAATMSKDDRLSFAGYSYHLSTDSTTGETRVEATNARGLTTGKYVHDRTGIKVDNPIQMMTKQATGHDTTDVYTGTDDDGDGSADGVGSALGMAAIGIAGASTIAGGYALANGKSKRVDRAYETVKHKVKGHIGGKDQNGKPVYFDKDTWKNLEDNGMAEQDKDGKWRVTEERKKVESYLSSTQPSSAGTLNQRYTNNPTNPTPMPTKNAVIDNSLETSSNGKNTPFDVLKYNTSEEISQAKERLSGKSDEDLGRTFVKEKVRSAKQSILEEIEDGVGSGDNAKVDTATKKLAGANKIIKSIDAGLDVNPKDLKSIGVDVPNVATEKTPNGYVRKKVDFESVGEGVRAVEQAHINASKNALDNPSSVHPSSVTGDIPATGIHPAGSSENVHTHAPKTRLGKVLGMLGVGGLGMTMLSSTADARSATPVPEGGMPEPAVSPLPLSGADATAFMVQSGFNALNATGAAMEMRNGASRRVSDLVSPSAYKDGFKQIVTDAVDVSDFKGAAVSFADEGIVEGVKIGGKALGKSAMKKLPFVGLGAGMTFAVQRAEDGDFIGAAMEFASGAVSMIPGIGTAASVAIDAALMKRDYDAATQPETAVPTSGNFTSPSLQNRQVSPSSFDASASTPVQTTPEFAPSNTYGGQKEDRPSSRNRVPGGGQQGFVGNSAYADVLTPQEEARLSPAEKIETVNERTQAMSDRDAGLSYLSQVSPRETKAAIAQEALSGTLTQEKMRGLGVPSDIIREMPTDANGAVSLDDAGALYKTGLSQIAGIAKMPEHPVFRYSGNLANSVNSGNISSAAAAATGVFAGMENVSVPESISGVIADQHGQSTTVSQQTASAVPQKQAVHTVVQEKIIESHGGTDEISLQSGGSNAVTDFARNATSPGNVQTSSSDIKKSIDEVGAALENARSHAAGMPAEQVSLNAFALGDLASGMALSAPIQTAGGELTLGNRDGYLTLGNGEGAIKTPVSSDFLQSAPPEAIDKLASTFTNSRLSNETITAVSEGEVYKGAMGMAGTEEMLYEMTTVNKKGAMDSRIQNDDQVTLLEDLVVGIEKMQTAMMPEKEKAS